MPVGPAITPQITQLLGPLLANHERIERYRVIAIKRAAGGRNRTARRAAPRASAFHELRRQLEEHAFYPPHRPRQASAAYRNAWTLSILMPSCSRRQFARSSHLVAAR
jgi:hypothetical protein